MSDFIRNKIQINLEAEIIAKIDLLIENGLYANRIAFLDKAIQNQINLHQTTLSEYETKKGFAIGILSYSSKDLEKIIVKIWV
jgi:metal-responsive CopG/Arc/MetJ family transcriptional regulator